MAKRKPGSDMNRKIIDYGHDACGLGMICNIAARSSHDIVRKGLEILVNLGHRGARGCDETTGDGAGILIRMPHEFMVENRGDFSLPRLGDYGAGLIFMPRERLQRLWCMRHVEQIAWDRDQPFLGWRKVPVNSAALGDLAGKSEPVSYQAFIGKNPSIRDNSQFERELFMIRKMVEKTIRDSDLPEKESFHVTAISSRTLIYKGMFLGHQLGPYFPDLDNPAMKSAMAIVHQRFSTNTFPAWSLAHPFRFLCHNGEINTLRGNINWMNAREKFFRSDLFGKDLSWLFPIATPGGSDSAILDNALELLYHTGRSLAHAVMMLIPEAWQNHETMEDEKKAFYEYHSCLMEPWDGPVALCFTDGGRVGAVLDRNGLRPGRYTVTRDGFVVLASETGVLDIPPENMAYRGRLRPGKMFLVDLDQKRIVPDEEIKQELSGKKPYRRWVAENAIRFEDLPESETIPEIDFDTLPALWKVFGYTQEDLKMIMSPMAEQGQEPIGSMGDDTPLAILSKKPRLLYDYFKQLFAQVTNPPLDPIREEMVTSLAMPLGAERSLLLETPEHCGRIMMNSPVLTNSQMEKIRNLPEDRVRKKQLSMLFPAKKGEGALRKAVHRLRLAAREAVRDGAEILILTDRGTDRENMAIPAFLATAAVHNFLIKNAMRTRCGIVVETGEARETHHFCCLLGYGAGAVNPYLALDSLRDLSRKKVLNSDWPTAGENYVKAIDKGVLKVMSKMGISTLQSYCGAQIFECIGLHPKLVEPYFTGTVSRIGGADLKIIEAETLARHESAYPRVAIAGSDILDFGGKYKWRREGEKHQYSPLMIARFQEAVRKENQEAWREYTHLVETAGREGGFIRSMLVFGDDNSPVPLEKVEPWTEIVKRFKTGGISYGSISKKVHETIAVAMNRIGAKSNSGEGGEDSDRFLPDENGNLRNSAIKQVASGRFGVTSNYLANAEDIQIKIAQGAKPGEGGQLPGFKVSPSIAKTRHSTPYVGLISPPPHHDIYSIEDLAQLIHDLKNANPSARINVKLVSQVGVGTVAAGVAKARGDVVLISGETGGTGASPQSSIRHCGLPWELGLAETQRALVINGLRSRIRVECDGQLKTGRDVAVACLLGADEFGFGTLALVALGCIMMRVCHLNTCPVGIATQDPDLVKKFEGKPEHLIAMMRFIAEDLRKIMAELGFYRLEDMVGRVDKLRFSPLKNHWKAGDVDLSAILEKPEPPPELAPACFVDFQDHGLDKALDNEIIKKARPALENREPVKIELSIRNVHRTVGTLLSHEISKRFGDPGLPPDTIVIDARGSAGQSFCAFGARGLTFHIQGDANDYFGKGLSGARLSIRPPDGSSLTAEENIIIGNVAFYGATAGEAYINGRAGERFCVRNSGVLAVVEGVGDHGCEYMTGGRCVILGSTGRNFAAGMSGGIAYVHDPTGEFAAHRCNREMVLLEAVENSEDIRELKTLIENHLEYTNSKVADKILSNWDKTIDQFVKVFPVDYKKALERIKAEENGNNREI